MAKQKAEQMHADGVLELLRRRGLDHLRVRKRGDLLTIESGPTEAPFRHARLRRVTVNYWTLEMPSHSSWQKTPFRGTDDEIVELLIDNFGWTLQPID